jgi:hypothetical protein
MRVAGVPIVGVAKLVNRQPQHEIELRLGEREPPRGFDQRAITEIIFMDAHQALPRSKPRPEKEGSKHPTATSVPKFL